MQTLSDAVWAVIAVGSAILFWAVLAYTPVGYPLVVAVASLTALWMIAEVLIAVVRAGREQGDDTDG